MAPAAPEQEGMDNQYPFNDLPAMGWLDGAHDDLPWQMDEQDNAAAKAMVKQQVLAHNARGTDVSMEDVDLYELFKEDIAARGAAHAQARALDLSVPSSDLSPNTSADSPGSLSATPEERAHAGQHGAGAQSHQAYLSLLAAANQANAMPQGGLPGQNPANMMQWQQLLTMQNAAALAALGPAQQQQMLLQQMQLAPLLGMANNMGMMQQMKTASENNNNKAASSIPQSLISDPVERVKEKRREAARRSRARKNCYVRQLEDENRTLKEQVIKLSRTVAKLQAEIRTGGHSSAAATSYAGLTAAVEGAASAAPADLDLLYACATAAL